MNASAPAPKWHVIAILIARLIFTGLFAMAATFKFAGMNGTAGYIASVGFPFPLLLAWLAASFETALVLCLLTGAYFTEASLLAAAYVLFLAFAFHGQRNGSRAIRPSSASSSITSPSSPACCSRRCMGPGSALALRKKPDQRAIASAAATRPRCARADVQDGPRQ